ncbi:MAG: hypothetical protein Q8L74_00495 [Nitrospirota bacterium]|nr:hypothetical protein [Nitrospirota bacterium]
MNRITTSGFRQLIAMLLGFVVLPGCAMTSHSRSMSTVTAALSYEMPTKGDIQTIVNLLEKSSRHVLGKPVTPDERTVPPLTADASSPVILQEQVLSLEGLGETVIPSIICPRALASMHTLIPGTAGLRLVASCIVASDTVTRIYLTDVTTGEPAQATLSHESETTSFISRIGEALRDGLEDLRPVSAPSIPIHRVAYHSPDTKTHNGERSDPTGEAARADSPNMVAHALPNLCFTPKTKGIAVRGHMGSSEVIGRLDSELIVQEDDPGRNAFLHVMTQDGQPGWVKRGDVRWASCPIA